MGQVCKAFGYYPAQLSVKHGPLEVTTLPDLETKVAETSSSELVRNHWYYAPPQYIRRWGGEYATAPYSARVFGLPRTHEISHSEADSEDHVDFHLWTLSLFLGMRLTAEEAGFLDNTPLRQGSLVDFARFGPLPDYLALAEAFWLANVEEPKRCKLVAAAIHALFVAQNRLHLQFEEFLYGYTALDACFALAWSLQPASKKVKPTHSGRIEWMCQALGMPTPTWAMPGPGEVAPMRNSTLHEALYMDAPLGFAVHGIGTPKNLALEMRALACRLLIGLLGAKESKYVKSVTNSRQRIPLRLTP